MPQFSEHGFQQMEELTYDGLNMAIHQNDEMFHMIKKILPGLGKASGYYFHSGNVLASNLKRFLEGSGRDPAQMTLLDFGAGYGRVARYFKLIFAEVIAADVDPEMTVFLKETLGIDAVLSDIDFRRAALPDRTFDVVFSCSVFTHLNPAIWSEWFRIVFERVAAGGYFVMTTRGREFHEKRGGTMDGEVHFAEVNENPLRLNPSIYGQTTVTRKFIEERVAAMHDLTFVAHCAGGKFDLFQDVNIFQRTH